MTAVLTLLVVILESMVITRIATIALMATGLTRESARFQARSALTGVGFTTSESEFDELGLRTEGVIVLGVSR